MLKSGILAALSLSFLVFIGTATAAGKDAKETMTRSQILREHHHLMGQMLAVMKDNVQMTQKLLDGKVSAADRKAMKRKLADMGGEVDDMIQKHDTLMKSFDEMTQKKEAPKPEKGVESAP